MGRVSVPESHPRRGSLYWVHVPDEPADKRRPALVVSPDGGLAASRMVEIEKGILRAIGIPVS